MNRILKYQSADKRTYFLLVIITMLLVNQLYLKAQSLQNYSNAEIRIIAKVVDEGVVLRWAPSNAHAWRVANRIGYNIERQDVNGNKVLINNKPVRHLPIDDIITAMEKRTDKDLYAIALMTLSSDTALMKDSLGIDTLNENKEKNNNFYGFALFAADNDSEIADALGLRIMDASVMKGQTYTYRIFLSRQSDYIINPGIINVVVGESKNYSPPANLTAKEYDGRIEIEWQDPPDFNYSGYNIYKSSGNSDQIKLNEKPIVILNEQGANKKGFAIYTDTSVTNYIKYSYTIEGIDPFGDLSIQVHITAMARDLTPPPAPFIKEPVQIDASSIKILWEYSTPPEDFAGFKVLRSKMADTLYTSLNPALLNANHKEYTDRTAKGTEPFYMVCAYDTAGNVSYSLAVLSSLIDTTSPSIPTGLSGIINKQGIAQLKWNENPEDNIYGYRLLWSNSLLHEFTMVTGKIITDTCYTDTVNVNTLTGDIYYRLAALNGFYTHSKLSTPLKIKRPDVVPPSRPVFTQSQISDSSVVLKWIKSSSTDVASQIILKAFENAGRFDTLSILPPNISVYVDNDVKINTGYLYHLVATDSSGNVSSSVDTFYARIYDTGIRKPITELKCKYNPSSNTTRLSWIYVNQPDEKFYFEIYRAFESNQFEVLAAVEGNNFFFEDNQLNTSGIYKYAVKVKTGNGAESQLSEIVSSVVYK